MTPIDLFMKGIDELWAGSGGDKITLRVIGSTALMMQTGYNRGTKDRDVLEADALAGDVGKSCWNWQVQAVACTRSIGSIWTSSLAVYPFSPGGLNSTLPCPSTNCWTISRSRRSLLSTRL